MRVAAESREQLAGRAADLTLSTGGRMPVSVMARRLGCPVSHLSRSFKRVRGQTLTEYRTGVRLARAVARLERDPAVDLTELALTCGYSSHSHFTASFRRHVGMTPSAFIAARVTGRGRTTASPALYDMCNR